MPGTIVPEEIETFQPFRMGPPARTVDGHAWGPVGFPLCRMNCGTRWCLSSLPTYELQLDCGDAPQALLSGFCLNAFVSFHLKYKRG